MSSKIRFRRKTDTSYIIKEKNKPNQSNESSLLKMQPQRQIYDPALRANCGEMKDVSRQVSCSGLWKAHQRPGVPEQSHPWSLHTSFQKQRYKYQLLPVQKWKPAPGDDWERKTPFSPHSPRLHTAGKLSQRYFISYIWVCIVFPPNLCGGGEPVLTAGSGKIRQQLAMTLKNMLMLRTKVKTCGFVLLYFFSRGTAEKQGYSS